MLAIDRFFSVDIRRHRRRLRGGGRDKSINLRPETDATARRVRRICDVAREWQARRSKGLWRGLIFYFSFYQFPRYYSF